MDATADGAPRSAADGAPRSAADAPPSPVRAAPPAAASAPASPRGGPVDPASFLHVSLDASLRELTPLHWAFDYLQAIRAGDVEFVAVALRDATRDFRAEQLREPLGPARQTLLHAAALLNQPAILAEFFAVANRAAAADAEAARLAVRQDALASKGGEANVAEYQARLGAAVDCVERVRGGGGGRGRARARARARALATRASHAAAPSPPPPLFFCMHVG